jgi:type II secretory pathway pseudopilin PulG
MKGVPQRRAFTVLEITVCAAMLAVLLSVLAATLGAVRQHARRLDERAVAMRTLENLMEAATVGPWESIDDERVGSLALPAAMQTRWPRAQLTARVVATDDPAPAKRVTLSLAIADQNARRQPLTLTTWIYQSPEDR